MRSGQRNYSFREKSDSIVLNFEFIYNDKAYPRVKNSDKVNLTNLGN